MIHGGFTQIISEYGTEHHRMHFLRNQDSLYKNSTQKATQ